MAHRFSNFLPRRAFKLRHLLIPGIALSTTKAIAGPYSPAPGQGASTAIPASSSGIVEWASGATIVRGVRDVENPTAYSSDPNSPLNFAYYGGPDGASAAASAASVAAGGSAITSTANSAPIGEPVQPQTTYDAVALGQNGTATLTFNQPITNGTGPDLAVFSNGFSSGAQEWVKPALVSVSSDGVNFFQFPSVSLTQTTTQVGNYGELDPTNLYDIAGNFPAGYGTPFDLSELAGVSPLLNVNDVTQVRITSVPGDINSTYAAHDSTGNIINSPYPAASQAGSEGFDLAGVGVLNALPVSQSTSLTWSNAGGTGVWNVGGDKNWNTSGAAQTYQDGDAVTFDNSIVTTNQVVTLNVAVSPTSVTVNNSSGSYTITGAGSITGSGSLTKSGNQKLTLATSNGYTGGTTVNAGVLELAVDGALPANSALTIAGGAQVSADRNTGLLILSTLNLDPTNTGMPAGALDLTSNGLVVHNGNLATITAAARAGANNLQWNGTSGILSSAAAADTAHLTAVGVIQNGSTAANAIYTATFDGSTGLNLMSTDVLVRYTYYGDANLDGQVDGSDYTLIDNGYLNQLTGWQNGDFNYDGIVDGSDYTLIDNAYSFQDATIADVDAIATERFASIPFSSVPEPTGLAAVMLGIASLRRRRLRSCVAVEQRSTRPATQASQLRARGFTLAELLIVIGIIGLLTAILLPGLVRARQQSQLIVCASNIRQLALANLLYAGDNHSFCVLAAADIFDDLGDGEGGHYRWHGTRAAANQPFDPALGPLAPYLGTTARVKNCPLFDTSVGAATGNNFEAGCGGYGYNEVYVGGRSDLYGYSPQSSATSAKLGQIRRSSETVMFTDAGIAQPLGSATAVTEYSFCEPPFIQENPGPPSTDLAWPSIHFRHQGRANVAWADGHVTAERLTFSNESYGLSPTQVRAANVGWFGTESNTLFQIVK